MFFRAITFVLSEFFNLDIWHTVHHGTVWVQFEGEKHRSKFEFTEIHRTAAKTAHQLYGLPTMS